MEWRTIEGFESYRVSSTGEVLNFKTGRKISTRTGKKGNPYPRVVLYNEGKQKAFKIHRLVAQAFIPNPRKLPVVNHRNGIKTDNRVENLEWTTIHENIWHAFETGLNK